MLKKLEVLWYVMIGLFVVYSIVCYADILAHNFSGGTDNNWNLLAQMLREQGVDKINSLPL